MPAWRSLRLFVATALVVGLALAPGAAPAQTAGADLSVDKADAIDPVPTGTPITYTVTVDNDGPEAASQVEVEDLLPFGATFVSAVPSQGTCTELLLVVTCDLGSLADEAVATVTIVIQPGGSGTFNNVVAVESTVPDPNPLNNPASETTTVTDGGGEGADLWVEKADAPDPVAPGADLTYVATVANVESGLAEDVILTDVLPLGVDFVSATTSQGSCNDPILVVLTCELGALDGSQSATVTIVVKPTSEGTIANTATVASASPDTNPGNNLSTATTTVKAGAFEGGGGGGGQGGGGGGGGATGGCTILGTALNDILRGTEQNDVICGLDGDDRMAGLGGKDIIRGGKDDDRAGGGKGPDKVRGQEGKDRLGGGAKGDRLAGSGGKDRLNGGPGKDRLNGGAGKDKCTRGKGDKLSKCP